MGLLSLAFFLYALPAVVAEEKRPFYDLPSQEMAQVIKTGAGMASLSPLEREIAAKSLNGICQSKKLAEDYFTAADEARHRLGTPECRHPLRDVKYVIVRTTSLQAALAKPAPGHQMDMAWLREQMSGPYRGVFIVKSVDDGPLEKYVLTFTPRGDGRVVSDVEMDVTYDPDREVEEARQRDVLSQVRRALTGKHEEILERLPPGKYEYLDAPSYTVQRVEMVRNPPQAGTDVRAGLYKVALQLVQRRDAPLYLTAERLILTVGLQDGVVTMASCTRDEAFAEEMGQKVKVAEYIVAFVSDVDGRQAQTMEGGKIKLPPGKLSVRDRQALPLSVEKVKRKSTIQVEGKWIAVSQWQVCCVLDGQGVEPRKSGFLFTLVETEENAQGLKVLYASTSHPMR